MLEGIQTGLARVNAAIHGAMEMGLMGSARLAGQSLKQDLVAIGDRLREITALRSVRIGGSSVLGVAATATSALADEPKKTEAARPFLELVGERLNAGNPAIEYPVSLAASAIGSWVVVKVAKARAPIGQEGKGGFRAPAKLKPLEGVAHVVYGFDHPEVGFLVRDLGEAATEASKFEERMEQDRYQGGVARSAVALGGSTAAAIEMLGFAIFKAPIQSGAPLAVTQIFTSSYAQDSIGALRKEPPAEAALGVYGPGLVTLGSTMLGAKPALALVLGATVALVRVVLFKTGIKSRHEGRFNVNMGWVTGLRTLAEEFHAGQGRFQYVDLDIPEGTAATEIAQLKKEHKLVTGEGADAKPLYRTRFLAEGTVDPDAPPPPPAPTATKKEEKKKHWWSRTPKVEAAQGEQAEQPQKERVKVPKPTLRVYFGNWRPELTFPGSPEGQAALRRQDDVPTVREQSLNWLETHPIEELRLERLGVERRALKATRDSGLRKAKGDDPLKPSEEE